MQVVAAVLQMAWLLFSCEMPLLGISYGAFTIGLFVVHLSISLLFPLLGIGGHVANDVGRGIRHRSVYSSRSKNSSRRQQLQPE